MVRINPYGFYVGYHVCLNAEEEIFGTVVDDREGSFDIRCDGRTWRKEGNVEEMKPFIGKMILVPEEKAKEVLNTAYEDYPKEFTVY